MSLERETLTFILVMLAGSLVFHGFGAIAEQINTRVYWQQTMGEAPLNSSLGLKAASLPESDLGIEYYVIARVHAFGWFFMALGAIGLIVKLKQAKLIE